MSNQSAKLLFFAHHNTTRWFQAIGRRLRPGGNSVILADLREDGDVNLETDFEAHMAADDVTGLAAEMFGAEVVPDMIARCRLTRNLHPDLATRMIDAMTAAIESALDKIRPDAAVALRVDHYIMDLLERCLAKRGIPFTGVTRAMLPGKVIFTSRGEYRPLREPLEEEVSEAIAHLTDPAYLSPVVSRKKTYGFADLARPWALYQMRAWHHDLMRHLQKRPNNWRYLTTCNHVEEYRMHLRNLQIRRLWDPDWRAKFEAAPTDKKIFVALQVNPEATIDYYVKNLELIDFRKILLNLVSAFSDAGYSVFVKDHPNMFGFRSHDLMAQLSRFGSVTQVPSYEPAPELILGSRATFTWTGTAGLQAAMNRRTSVVVQPWYAIDANFIRLRSAAAVGELPSLVEESTPEMEPADFQEACCARIQAGAVPGKIDYVAAHHGRTRDEDLVPLVDSLIRYLDRAFEAGPFPLGANKSA